MSTRVAELAVRITGDGSSASRALDQVGSKSSSFASKASKAGAVAGKVLAGGLLVAGAAAFKATQAAAADEAAQSKLAQTLAKAGGATRDQIAATEAWITAQGKSKGVADDELRPALSQLVAVTHDVGKSQKLATLAMDIAAARGVSLESVTKSLAKAQTNGAAGLAKLGVQTKNAAGETLSLDQVQKKLAATYGGAAAKAAETTAGKQKILAVQMGELQEQIGQKLLPVMLKLADVGLKVIDWVSRNTTLVGILIGVLGGLLAITYAVGVAVKLYATYTKVAAAAQWLLNTALTANPIGLVIVALAALAAGLIIAYKKSETFRRIVDAAFAAIKRVVIGAVTAVVGFVRSHWRLLLVLLTGPFGLAFVAIQRYGGRILSAVQSAFTRVRNAISSAAGAIPGLVRSAWSALAGIAGAAWEAVRSRVAGALDRLRSAVVSKVDNVVSFFTKLPQRIVSAVGDLGSLLKDAGVQIIQGLIDGIWDKVQDLQGVLSKVTDLVPDWKGPRDRDRKLLRGAGELIIDGLVAGIDSRTSKVKSKLQQLTKDIRGSVQATTADPITLRSGSSAGAIAAGSQAVPVQIIVQGAIDPVQTARQVRELLTRSTSWSPRALVVTP